MGWQKIINQTRIKEYLQRILREKKIANAYCFFGEEGVGKFAMAIEFIKSLSCLKPIVKDGFYDSCGICLNCKNIDDLKYPNIEYVFSLPSGKAGETESKGTLESLPESQINEINEKLKYKITNPYTKFTIEGASQIRISQIRELRRTLSYSNSLPGRKFVVIFNAEDMRVEAQNAFLKTLEEPRKDVTFILLTLHKDALLPTILSRCQILFFPPLPREEVKQFLIKDYGKNPQESDIIAQFANGSMTRAIDLLDSDIKNVRDGLIDLLGLTLMRNLTGKQLTERINQLVEKFDKKKSFLALDLLEQWLRDALLISRNGPSDFVVNFDTLDRLKRFKEKFGNKPIEKAIEAVERSHYFVSSNVQIPNVFLNLFLQLRDVLF